MNRTPGDWKYDGGKTGAVHSSIRLVASVYPVSIDAETEKEMVANCNLIAAAPLLFESAKYALKCLDEGHGWIAVTSAIQSLREAIAKAEGRI